MPNNLLYYIPIIILDLFLRFWLGSLWFFDIELLPDFHFSFRLPLLASLRNGSFQLFWFVLRLLLLVVLCLMIFQGDSDFLCRYTIFCTIVRNFCGLFFGFKTQICLYWVLGLLILAGRFGMLLITCHFALGGLWHLSLTHFVSSLKSDNGDDL